MGILCKYASKKRESAPDSFSLETGVFCSIFGVTSPGCKFLDILPTLFNSVSTAEKAADFIRIAYRVTKVLPEGLVDTAEFCKTEPPSLTDDDIVTWGDVFSAFNGLYPDALVEKMSKVFAYTRWFEYCQCTATSPDPTPIPPPGFPPRPLIPVPDPAIACSSAYSAAIAFWAHQYDDRVAASAAWLAANPGQYELQGVTITDPVELSNLRAACYPFCIALPSFGDSSSCICRYSANALAIYSWVEPDPNNNGRRFGIFDRLPVGFEYAPDCPEPDPIPDPIPDPDEEEDNGREFCTYFPELCIECPPSEGCKQISVEVKLLSECGAEASTITVKLNSCGDDPPPPPPDCAPGLAAVVDSFQSIAGTYGCSSFQQFIDDTQSRLEEIKLESPGCEVEMESRRDAVFSTFCIPEE
ncbi:MAG: hypothetical protein ACEQSC_00270 [Candidatus Nanopelagicaceae bacterium]